jgi:hypothetical protein
MSGSVVALVLALAQFGQSQTGELRLVVADGAGLPVQTTIEIASETSQVRERLETNTQGVALARRLPFGRYRIAVTHGGFAPFAGFADVRSAVPTDFPITLGLAPVQAQITVRVEDTLLDGGETSSVRRLGAEALGQRVTSLPGRALPDLVNTQPGWLLEANGILHPRGSEYQTQYVIDGLPLTDNRSPAFAPEVADDEIRAMHVFTGGYPAEYGRKLGGVIEVVTGGSVRRGLHGSVGASVAGFATRGGTIALEQGWERSTFSLSAGLAGTDRYLDPPVEKNYTNRGTSSHVSARFERDLTGADRIGLIVRRGRSAFLVPNEPPQEAAGQRQDRDSEELAGQFSYQRILSPRLLADVRGLARSLSAGLWSNAAATPIAAEQARTFDELYVKGTLSAHVGRHEWKVGGDMSRGALAERFGYRITDPSRFDDETPRTFAFAGEAPVREQALFVQDQVRVGRWTANLGLRWDHYDLLIDEHAFSPRFGVAWATPSSNLVLRASYDRAFQTPPIENLLLAGSEAGETLSDEAVRLPVPTSRGHFLEVGLSARLARRVRVDVNHYLRDLNNFADDDLLLNTGVGIPIAFDHARIRGTEVTWTVPTWRTLSGTVSYSHMRGTGDLPLTGGLFLDDEAAVEPTSTARFALTQDQRHTIRGRATWQVRPTAWAALGVAYGSGLPFEFEGNEDEAAATTDPRILNRVNFDTGRVRPSLSWDASGGVTIRAAARGSLRVQADVRNLANRLNVINFDGLFSGTALAPPRSAAIRLRVDF